MACPKNGSLRYLPKKITTVSPRKTVSRLPQEHGVPLRRAAVGSIQGDLPTSDRKVDRVRLLAQGVQGGKLGSLDLQKYDDFIWLNMIEYDFIWLNMIEYDWIWLNMIEYDWIWLNMNYKEKFQWDFLWDLYRI